MCVVQATQSVVICYSHNKELTYYVKWICEFYYLVLTKLFVTKGANVL